MSGKIILRFEVTVQAPVKQLYRAFSNKVGLEEWLCDSAFSIPRPGGALFLNWNSGYYSSGKFVELKPDKQIKFTWRGPQDPGETLVTVKFKKQDSSTAVEIIHTGIWEGKKWHKTEEEIKKGWISGLRNLSAVLESGPDLRITTRPMLGIYLGNTDPELLKKAGVPVSAGVRLEGVIEGLGAQKCGLQKDDVLVDIDGIALENINDFSKVMPGHKAGDVLNVTFYRQQEKRSISMELAPRKTAPLPANAAALAAEVDTRYSATDQELFPYLYRLTDDEASHKPSPEEWSIKEILAHLIHCERDLQAIIHKATTSESADFSDNTSARIQSTLQAYPTLGELISEFKHAEAETLAFLANLPSEFTTRKSSLWTLTNQVINFNDHTREHLEQMRKIHP